MKDVSGNDVEGMKTALAVSIASRAVGAISGLLALPIYLKLLGVEAYGIVGLFSSLQALIAFMEFGLAATLTRQLARAAVESGLLQHARDTALTYERAYLGLAALVTLLVAGLAPWIASTWVNLNTLTQSDVSFSLQLAAASLAFGWPTNLYGAGLAGLHRQVPLAVSTSAFAILRVAITVCWLWQVPALESFFWGQLLTSALQAAATRVQLWRALALPGHRASSCWRLLLQERKFAGGMTVITVTSILLTQTDKLILSHVLPLAEFGVYTVAASLATALYIVISPMFSVIYPRISSVWRESDTPEMVTLYHACSQAMAALVAPLAAVIVCFPAASLYVLTRDATLSAAASSILVLLVVGAALNGIMNVPYSLQLAGGWTSLSVWLNLATLVIVAPVTWWAAGRYGALGGAATWAAVNVAQVMITPSLLHQRLLKREKWRWYREGVLLPGLVSVGTALALAATWRPDVTATPWMTGLQLGACWLITAFCTIASMPHLRSAVKKVFWR